MDSKEDIILNKLILLYFMDMMDVPLNESSILKACYYENSWLEYIDCISTLSLLEESGFLFRTSYEKVAYYSITPSGRACISEFETRIPSSRRHDVGLYVADNRVAIRRKQEYPTSYQLNPDKTYTVLLKIIDPTNPQKVTMDLKFIVPNKDTAKSVASKWNHKAAQIYLAVYEQLVD